MAQVNLDVAMESTSQQILEAVSGGGGGSVIKSIQRGTISIPSTNGGPSSATATISAVDVTKSIVIYSGHDAGASSTSTDYDNIYLILTNSTTVTAGTSRNHGANIVPYQVVEYV